MAAQVPDHNLRGYREEFTLQRKRETYMGALNETERQYLLRERLMNIFMMIPSVLCSGMMNPRHPYDLKAYVVMLPIAVILLGRAMIVDQELSILRGLKEGVNRMSHDKDDCPAKYASDCETRNVFTGEGEFFPWTLGSLSAIIYAIGTSNDPDCSSSVILKIGLVAAALAAYHGAKRQTARDHLRTVLRAEMPFIAKEPDDAASNTTETGTPVASGSDDAREAQEPFSFVRITNVSASVDGGTAEADVFAHGMARQKTK